MTTSSEHNSKYSLTEILHSVYEHHRTGLISILADCNPTISIEAHYLWVQNGQVVSVANRLDGMGLLGEISRRKLLSSTQIRAALRQLSQLSQPLGLHLKSLELLDAGQLRLLFNAQTFKVLKLSRIDDRLFHFDPAILPCTAEMTGIEMSVQELIRLLNLKVLPESSPPAAESIDPSITIPESPPTLLKATAVSTSFLGNLMGFLKRKGS